MSGALSTEWAALLGPHIVSVALVCARLFPVSLLCPLLGGPSIPQLVRLGLVLALSLSLHFAGGVRASEPPDSALALLALLGREAFLGVALGLIAALPFDAARMGGRFIDLFRGTSAEAALPLTGTKETATGDGLYQLLVALAVTGAGLPLVLAAVWKTFAAVPLGAFVPTEAGAMTLVRLAMAVLAAGLAIGAPVAGVSLGVDCLLGLAARAAPQMSLQEVGAPLRIMGGAAVLWMSVGLFASRLLSLLSGAADELRLFVAVLP